MEPIPIWQRNRPPAASPPPAAAGRRWWRSLRDRPQNSARSKKSGPSRKCAGASAPENIQVLEQAGITVDKFGGEAFRAAVSDGQTELAKLLLEKGADIITTSRTWCSLMPPPLSPRPPAPTISPWCAGWWNRGADITIADKYGDRPYTVAAQNKNQELADYLKALEPENWHNEQEKAPAAHALQAARQAGGILKDRPLAFGISGTGTGKVGGTLSLHGCAGDDLEAEKNCSP